MRLTLLLLVCIASITPGIARPAEVVELEPFLVRSTPATIPPAADVSGTLWRQSSEPGLAELLETKEPGLALVRKAAMSNDVVLRGIGGEDIGVSLDGRPIHTACSNRMDPPLSHAAAETTGQVQIAAGPFSLKRAGSLGGRINIVSEPVGTKRQGSFETRLGSFGQAGISGLFETGDRNWGFRVHGAASRSDPYENGSGLKLTEFPKRSANPLDDYLPQFINQRAFEAGHAGIEVRRQLNPWLNLRTDLNFRKDRDLLFPGLKMDADETETLRLGLRLEADGAPGPLQNWTADFYHHETDHVMSDHRRFSSRLSRGGGSPRPPFVLDRGWFMRTEAEAENYGTSFDTFLPAGDWGELQMGTAFEHRQWNSRNTIGAKGNAMLPDVSQLNLGAYAQLGSTGHGPWQTETGLRLDWFGADAGGDTAFLVKRQGTANDWDDVLPAAFFTLRRESGGSSAVFAGLGTAARPPSPQELYIQVDKPEKPGDPAASPADWVGNPQLDAPRSVELTAGMETHLAGWELRGRFFHLWLEDWIYRVGSTFPDEAPLETYTNIDARIHGFELKADRKWGEFWHLAGALAYQEGEKATRPPGATNDNLAGVPPLRARAALSFQSRDWLISCEARASDNQDRTDPDLFERDLGSWFTLGLRVGRTVGNWTLTGAVDNLFDETYAVHNAQVANPFSAFTVVDEPGRSFSLTARYAF